MKMVLTHGMSVAYLFVLIVVICAQHNQLNFVGRARRRMVRPPPARRAWSAIYGPP